MLARLEEGGFGKENMAKTAEVAVANGNLKTSPEEYRRAVALSMRHTEYRNGAWTDIPVTDEEVSYLLLKAAEYGLNPLKGQIYATWRSGRIQVETTLEGLRVIAERTGEYQGQLSPEWFDGESGKWTEVWTMKTPPTAARWGVLRKGFPKPVLVTVHWEEFKQTKGDGSLTAIWNEKPAHMLAKNAASLAFRAAFPGEAGGIYTAEEMAGVGQAKPSAEGVAPPATPSQAPVPAVGGNGNDSGAAAIVDAPATQPSGPPATPATSGRLAAVLEQAGYSRLKVDLAKLVFDQHPDRLSEEETQRLANALTAAESAGITVVELERACKRGVKYQDIALRRKALFQWIEERGKKAAVRSSQRQGASAGEAPTGEPESKAAAEEPVAAEPAEAEEPPPPDADDRPAAILDEEPQDSGGQ